MNNISIIRYFPCDDNRRVTAGLVECYRDVFADSPWHEWLVCPICKKYWGKKDGGALVSLGFRHCDTPLSDFWSREKVVSDLLHEITPETSCWLAMDGEVVVGFCWGYPIIAGNLEEKLGVSLNGKFEDKSSMIVAYQDEVGVLPAYRGLKIAKSMVEHRLGDFLAQGMEFGIVRTRQHPEPSVTFFWYTKKLGYEIFASYPDDDGRVVLGRELRDLQKLLS